MAEATPSTPAKPITPEPTEGFGLTAEEQAELVNQAGLEYDYSCKFMKVKWEQYEEDLRLFSSQKLKTKKEKIGDRLMFTIFQTSLAALYTDELTINFHPNERGDVETAVQINDLATFDWTAMEMDIARYKWIWMTLFFGRGLIFLLEFDSEKKQPVPEVPNMMLWFRDPVAQSVNGDSRGRGAMRFGGRPIMLTKRELEDGPYKEIEDVRAGTEDKQHKKVRQTIEEAMGFGTSNSELQGENLQFPIVEWFTHFKGKKVVIGLANDRKKLVRYSVLKQQEKWGIIDRSIFPDGVSWDGESIPSLTKDEQRARSSAQNLALHGMKAGQYPMYEYDKRAIPNPSQLNFGFNKFIGVNSAPGSIKAIDRQSVKPEVFEMMNLLSDSAQRATATPDIQQGIVSGTKRSATELSLVAQRVDSRITLMADVGTWADKRFWEQWYRMYKDFLADSIDKKTVRILGTGGYEWREFTKDQLKTNKDPDVTVESKIVSEAKRLSKLQESSNFLTQLRENPVEGMDMKEALIMLAEMNGLTPNQIDRIFPTTIDEIMSENENEALSKNKMVEVKPRDDDKVHIQRHNKAAETKAKKKHIEAHIKQMEAKLKNPNIQPPVPPEEAEARGSMPKLNFNTPSTLESAIPTSNA